MSEPPTIQVPVKQLVRCAYCNDLLGIKPHPMLPKYPDEPKPDHCTCHLVDGFEPRSPLKAKG